MSNEATKANRRRSRSPEYSNRYLVGHGIDIGCGDDNIGQHTDLFPKILSCRGWDQLDGDAQYLSTIPDNHYDFVHSSHCLEHMIDPYVALKNWFRVLKPGGHAIIMVPDEDMYEQRIWPSTYNPDHKFTFTIYKQKSWSDPSIDITSLLEYLENCKPILIRLNEEGFDPTGERRDQTRGEAESSIEFILRKL